MLQLHGADDDKEMTGEVLAQTRVKLVFARSRGKKCNMAEALATRLAAARQYMLLAAAVVAPFARPKVGLWLSV